MWCVYAGVTDPGPRESVDEDEEDSIWRDLRDRSLADAGKRIPPSISSSRRSLWTKLNAALSVSLMLN